jgi:glutamate--cysteine ligase
MNQFSQDLQALSPHRLQGILRGIEKESLRVMADGTLALTAHPAALGSALTHRHITTDFSESQLELITGVHSDVTSCLAELTQIQQVTMRAIGDELLWASSMPCTLPADEAIPIGQYGNSNSGRSKSVYRTGLGYRYGRRMQTISGIHYNWSLPGLSSEDYFGLIRNFRRHVFLPLVLFGASPAVCSTFVAGRTHQLQTLNRYTKYLPFATSLRMGRLGYQSDAQAALAVSYNSLPGYVAALQEAMGQSYARYEAIGVLGSEGAYRQLNTSLLQIENEFYASIRPKRVVEPGERALHALRERGVEYVEVRLMDLDPFESVGINSYTMRFLDVFLVHCLVTQSPPDTPAEISALATNQHLVAERGREPGLLLQRGESQVLLTDWATQLVDELQAIAQHLDTVYATTEHTRAVAAARQALAQPESLPSARVLKAVMEQPNGSFVAFVRGQSQHFKQAMGALPLAASVARRYAQMAQDSLQAQHALEASDTLSFDAYLAEYLSPQRLAT